MAQSTRRCLKSLCVLGREQRGSVAVEMGIIALAFLAFLVGILQFGYALWLQNALNYSVAAAARCASLSCSTDIASYAADASGAGFASTVFSLGTAACGNQVTASYAMVLPIPFVSNSAVTLTAQACYPT
jgi:Flp pilus assembly protein TadG